MDDELEIEAQTKEKLATFTLTDMIKSGNLAAVGGGKTFF